MVRFYIRVSGRVQGVGFRWFTSMTASRRDLTGWVRNREDGGVEREVRGDGGPVEEFIQSVSRGPRCAIVEGMERRQLIPEAG